MEQLINIHCSNTIYLISPFFQQVDIQTACEFMYILWDLKYFIFFKIIIGRGLSLVKLYLFYCIILIMLIGSNTRNMFFGSKT